MDEPCPHCNLEHEGDWSLCAEPYGGGSDQRLVTLSSEATTTGDHQMDQQVDALVEIAINRAMPTVKEMLKQEMLKRFEFTPTKRG